MTKRRVRFYSRLLAVLFCAALPVLTPHPSSAIDSCTAAPTTNCAGFQGWYEPVPLNASYPWFGSYIYVMAVYHTNTNCDGRATKHADTGTWQNVATKQTSDGYTGYVCMPPTVPQGNERNIRVGMTSAMTGFAVTGTVDTHYAQGGFTNHTRTQDTVTCSVPGAGSTQLTNIPFELCYDYSTSAGGYSVNHQPNDATTFLQIARSSGDNYSWDTANGYDIQHTNGQNQQSVCNTGKFIVQGTQGNFYITMTADDAGTQFIATQGGPAARQGDFQTYFQITSKPMGVTCTSKSGVFPGADGVTQSQAIAQKQSDGAVVSGTLGFGGQYFNALGSDCSGRGSSGGGSNAAAGGGAGPSKFIGNPINLAQGFKVEGETDYAGPMGLGFTRVYRSNGTWLSYNLGTNWRHNFNRTLTVSTASPPVAALTDENGVVTRFRQQTNGSWKSYDLDVTTKFESLFNSVPTLIGYGYTRDDNTKEIYNTTGKLTRIEYLGSVALNLTYDGSGRLSAVTDESGRSLTLTYDGSSRVSTLVTPDGTYTYTYGANNNLTQVTKPDTKTRIYHYENATFVNALTGITDERGIRVVTWAYDTTGRAVSSEYAGNVGEYTAAYNSDGTVTVTNPLGKQTIYDMALQNNVRNVTRLNGLASTNCPASSKTADYSGQGWVSQKTDWEGNTTRYVYDSRGLETLRTEAFGTPEERTITTTWESAFRLPNVVTRTGRTTDYDYDSFGRLTKITITDTATSETRIWNYAYYANTTVGGNTVLGRLKEIDGPRTDVTDKLTYTYDANFNLTKVTNALNQETQITARDSAGRPTTVKDINNVQSNLTYDTNGWLQTVTGAVGTPLQGVTTFSYNFAGDVTGIDLPNGTTLTYTYDNARRVTKITDDLGNSVNYTLNDAGDVTQAQYKDPANALKYTHTRTFDELSRLLTSVGAASAWTRSFAYDKNSNLKTYTNANNHATQFAYDPLERLTSSTDALSGVTDFTDNALNQTTGVKDPRNNSTTYTYNAFGDVTQMVSPDTATTNFVVNKNGDVTQMTDARSVVTNYTYDALNRLATVAYPSDTALNVTLTYDDNPTPGNCGTSKGRLCRVVDAAGTTDYKYNALGQLIEVKEVRGALTFTTAYEYDLAGVLKKITLPSGRQVTYTLNGNGQVTNVAAPINGTATNLASSITYLPYGPMTGLIYGNTKTLSATYDQDYRPTNRTVSGVFNHTYDTDNDGNITQKGVRTYTYDVLERLNAEAGGTATSFTYDGIGNRLTETAGGTTTYSYPSTNSKLSSVGANSYTYDAMGNVTGDGVRTYVWSAAGLLKDAKIGGSTVGTYTYDASNLRTKKVAGGTTTHYVYGLGGKLYGEYDNSGVLIREYIWLNGEPLAQVTKSGATETVTYLHTDHLATPRYGTNAAGSTVWTWDSGAFGKEAPTGSATVNLRFPGQYYDSESTLHYNWNRYYNPAIGRYISSDPIGLAGGLNTFGYAGQSPLVYFDPHGLYSAVGTIARVCIGVIIDWGMTPIEEAPTTEDAQADPEQEKEISKPQEQGADPGGSGDDEPPEEEDDGSQPTSSDAKNYNQHGGGKNAKHSNPDAREAARQKWLDAKRELEEAKRSGASKSEKSEIERRIKHWKKKMDFSGEHHSQKPKGPR